MAFDFSNTCSDIDTNIHHTKDTLDDRIEELITEYSPLIKDTQLQDLVLEWREYIYAGIENCFEQAIRHR